MYQPTVTVECDASRSQERTRGSIKGDLRNK